MITKETAAAIWTAYREIEHGEQLLADVARTDSYIQLVAPRGEHANTPLLLKRELAESFVRAHIAEKRGELLAANERARAELDAASSGS